MEFGAWSRVEVIATGRQALCLGLHPKKGWGVIEGGVVRFYRADELRKVEQPVVSMCGCRKVEG